MTEQQTTPAPTAMGTAVEFSMAWLDTQGSIGKMVQRTLMTALQENDQLQQLLQGQTQELAKSRETLEAQQQEIIVWDARANDPHWLRSQLNVIPASPVPPIKNTASKN